MILSACNIQVEVIVVLVEEYQAGYASQPCLHKEKHNFAESHVL
jgi:hypothetical protein